MVWPACRAKLLRSFVISFCANMKLHTQPIYYSGIQNWMLILILASKSDFGDDFGQYDTETIILCPLFGQTPIRNSVVMAKPKVPSDQKLFERVCYTLKLKVTKFPLFAPPPPPPPPSKIGLKCRPVGPELLPTGFLGDDARNRLVGSPSVHRPSDIFDLL